MLSCFKNFRTQDSALAESGKMDLAEQTRTQAAFSGVPVSTLLDMLALSMLIYEYGSDQLIKPHEDAINMLTIKRLLRLDLSDTRKAALTRLYLRSPGRKMRLFVDDEVHTGLQAAVTVSPALKRITVVFRGSESKQDWVTNFDLSKENLNEFDENLSSEIKVHSGFKAQLLESDAYALLKLELLKVLHKNPSYSVFTTGHSLGGALSTLFGFLLSNEIAQRVIVVSFGSPRVGNRAWRAAFDAKANLTHYRIAHGRDMVTAMPLLAYHHVGKTVTVDESDGYIVYPQYDYPLLRFSPLYCTSVQDHATDGYYNALLQWEGSAARSHV